MTRRPRTLGEGGVPKGETRPDAPVASPNSTLSAGPALKLEDADPVQEDGCPVATTTCLVTL